MKSIYIGIALACGLLCGGCSAKKRIDSVPPTFLEGVDMKSKRDNLPFAHSWVSPNTHKSDYLSVDFKPIRTELLPKTEWEKSISTIITSKKDFDTEADGIAEYFREQIIQNLQSHEKKRFSLAKGPGSKTMTIQVVLTELEFSHPVSRAASLISPVPGTGVALSAISDPHVAFAARVTDSATGALLGTFADRRFAPTRVIDLNKFTATSSAREICALWAKAIADALNEDKLTKIEIKSFDWKPW